MSKSTTTLSASISALEQQALAAQQHGELNQALAHWTAVLSVVPGHVRALMQVGQLAFGHGDFHAARHAFQRATSADGRDPHQWTNLALACLRLGDESAAEDAIFQALSVDPYDLFALVLRGQMFERRGNQHRAAAAYGAAATVAPPLDRLPAEMRAAVSHAMQFHGQHQQAFGEFVDAFLAPHLQGCRGAELDRFRLSMDILLGRKRRHDAQPMRYFIPQLPPVEFFERAQFPWLDAIEAGTDAIRDEFLSVLGSDADIAPYITYGSDQPVAQWAELNHSPRWSAFHLVKDGKPVPENAARCPQTMALWSGAPSPDQPGRTPVAMFSLLKPKTHIPAHVGASNARLVTHLPLIVPANCRFRVGNTVREWVPGKAWVFDDTIEHEAWNDSDQLRVVMIFDIWHPALTAEERRMITALNAALNAFNGSSAVDYDV